MRSEFEFLKHLKNHFNLSGIGDDCAIIPKDDLQDLLITSDILTDNIDFRLQWTNPKDLGYKTLAVSVSDISAMGGIPLYSLTSISIPEYLWDSTFLDEFYDGYHQCARSLLEAPFGSPFRTVELIGGDISKSDSGLVIDSTLIGTVGKGKAVLRSGANPGDQIFVTGSLGHAAYGLRILDSKGSIVPDDPSIKYSSCEEYSITRQLKGNMVNGHRFSDVATAMIDISDGLSSDLVHLCNASHVGACIQAEKLPLISNEKPEALSHDERIELALNGGEDFELLLTAPAPAIKNPKSLGLTWIGEITDNNRVIQLVEGTASRTLFPQGFRHF